MSSFMNTIIDHIRNGKISDAVQSMFVNTDITKTYAEEAVEALRPYLDPQHPEFPKASVRPPEAKEEGIQKWLVTARSPEKEIWFADYVNYKAAVDMAKLLCSRHYTDVKISQVIAEAKPVTTWTIDL